MITINYHLVSFAKQRLCIFAADLKITKIYFSMKELKDSIDFGRENIPSLFRKMLYPTLLGMLFSAVFIITDGIFVGHGLGSDALAAINIVAPLFLFSTGIGLMFGMGASIVASIHLSTGKNKAARINMTQALSVSSIFLLLCTIVVLFFPDEVLYLFGCSERLLAPGKDYLYGFVPFLTTNALICSAGFFVRLSGAPRYAMTCSVVAALINILFDYLFIFVFKWGMFGAAFATGIGTLVGVVMMIIFLSKRSNVLHFIRIKMSKKSMQLTWRNTVYVCNLGFSSFLCELAIASMMLCGNYVFMREMGEDGVAAFSIACYFFPIIFMLYNSIAQSAQPIISYNYGANLKGRVKETLRVALKTALICGSTLIIITIGFDSYIVSMFISSSAPAHAIATHGFPLFALGFLPFAVNIVSIGYFQSIEKIRNATIITVLRGFVFMITCFVILPHLWGKNGVWLAVPTSELLTFFCVMGLYWYGKRKSKVKAVSAA